MSGFQVLVDGRWENAERVNDHREQGWVGYRLASGHTGVVLPGEYRQPTAGADWSRQKALEEDGCFAGAGDTPYNRFINDVGIAQRIHELSCVFPYRVYSGSEKLDLGPKRVVALCSSLDQAEAVIRALWPDTGYWEMT